MSIKHLFPSLRKKAEFKLLKPNEPLPAHVGPKPGVTMADIDKEQGFNAPGGKQIRNPGLFGGVSAGIEGLTSGAAGGIGALGGRLAEAGTWATDKLGLTEGAQDRAGAMTDVMDETAKRGLHQFVNPTSSQAVSNAPWRTAGGTVHAPTAAVGLAFGAPTTAVAGAAHGAAKATDAAGLTNNWQSGTGQVLDNQVNNLKASYEGVKNPVSYTPEGERSLKEDPLMTRVNQIGQATAGVGNIGAMFAGGNAAVKGVSNAMGAAKALPVVGPAVNAAGNALGAAGQAVRNIPYVGGAAGKAMDVAGKAIGGAPVLAADMATIPMGLKPREGPEVQVFSRLNQQQQGSVVAQASQRAQELVQQGMPQEQAYDMARDATYKQLLDGELDINKPAPPAPAAPAAPGGAPAPGAPPAAPGAPPAAGAAPNAAVGPDPNATAPGAPAAPPEQQQSFGQPVRGQSPNRAPQAPAADAAPQYDKNWVDQHQMHPEQFMQLSQQIKSPAFQQMPIAEQKSAVQKWVYAGAARDAAEQMAKDPNFNPNQYVGGIVQQAQSNNWSPENMNKMFTNATTEQGLDPKSPDAFAWFSKTWSGLNTMQQVGLLLGGSLIIGGIASALFGDNGWAGLLMGLLGVGAIAGSAYSAGWLDPILKQLGIGGGGEGGTEGAGPALGGANGTSPPADPAAPAAGTPPVPAGAPPAPGAPPGPNPAPGAVSGPPGAPGAAPKPPPAPPVAGGKPGPYKATPEEYAATMAKLPPAQASQLNKQYGSTGGKPGVIDDEKDVTALVTDWAQRPEMDTQIRGMLAAMNPQQRAAVVAKLQEEQSAWFGAKSKALDMQTKHTNRFGELIKMLQS